MPDESKPVEMCPLCGKPPEFFKTLMGHDLYNCPRCGNFGISRHLAWILPHNADVPAWALSAYTRQCTIEARNPYPVLDASNFRAIASDYSRRTVGWQMDRLLQILRESSAYLGAPAEFEADRDYPLIRGRIEEARKLLDYFKETGLLDKRPGDQLLILTVEAWRRLESASPRDSGRCLVAMHFDPELLPVYRDGIGPAVETDCGYTANRVDLQEFNGKVCDQILADIKQSAFVVADFTGHRQNVYFEAGFALGFGLKVIFCVRAGSVEEAHFDTRQYNHIVWSDPADLRAKLKARIIATVGHRQPT